MATKRRRGDSWQYTIKRAGLLPQTTLTDIKIASITGHRDPRQLKRYANLRASDLADQLW